MTTLYWHDYETWGVNPAIDRPAQFAGLRTDEDLNVVGDPLVIYCKPAEDILPHPEACLVTGITPQKAAAEGFIEAEFILQILKALGKPGTCGVGYNSLRFDDEVTRYTAYRNFYDPYEREWKNGNGRWDIIDMVRACYALRPQGIEWPQIDGKPTFKLEHLTGANGISHAAAHDALSDVEATIALAKRVKTAQPGLYDHIYSHKHKTTLAPLVDLNTRKPLLHVSSMFRAEHGCASLIMPLAMHPTNKNAVIVVDLTAPPEDLINLDADEVAQRVFTSSEHLPDGVTRIPLKLVHLNKCPVLLTPKLLTPQAAKRLAINLDQCEQHWQQLLKFDLTKKVQAVMAGQSFPPKPDAEQQLYDGFIPGADKHVMQAVRAIKNNSSSEQTFAFTDQRLQQMVLPYKARNFPELLTAAESKEWFERCKSRLTLGEEGVLSTALLKKTSEALIQEYPGNVEKTEVLRQLQQYATAVEAKYGIGT